MKRVSAVARRILLVVAGVVIAGGALVLVLWGLSGRDSAPDGPSSSDESRPIVATEDRRSRRAEENASRWQEFTRGGSPASDPAVAGLRPIERLANAVGSPFDQAYAWRELARLRLRLEGVGRGEQPLALISGRVVRVGDRIEGLRVETIARSGVTLVGPNGIRVDLLPQLRAEPSESQAESPTEADWRATSPSARRDGARRGAASEGALEGRDGEPTGDLPEAASQLLLRSRGRQSGPGK